MPLGPKRKPLEIELTGILSNESPLNGQTLAKALSKFSMGILPPTLGIFLGIAPAAAAYEAAPPFGKTKGIEDAINTFASYNATGMSPFAFKGTAPPKIKNLQKWFDLVRDSNGTTKDLAKFLSYAILANYTLGKSKFLPTGTTIPTWNIPGLPGAVKDEMDSDKIDAKMATAAAQIATKAEIDELGQLEQDSFFDNR